jgi:hypothetical protein
MKYRNVDYSTWSQGRNSGRTHYPTISQEEVLKIGRKACEANKAIRNDEYIRNGALLILNNLVKKHGVRFHDLKAPTVVSWPLASTETLEFLLAHGWNINSCRDINPRDPFLWRVTSDEVIVKWCLDHGARVKIAGERTRPLLSLIGNRTNTDFNISSLKNPRSSDISF